MALTSCPHGLLSRRAATTTSNLSAAGRLGDERPRFGLGQRIRGSRGILWKLPPPGSIHQHFLRRVSPMWQMFFATGARRSSRAIVWALLMVAAPLVAARSEERRVGRE